MLSRSPRISRTGLELVLSYQHWNAYRAAYLSSRFKILIALDRMRLYWSEKHHTGSTHSLNILSINTGAGLQWGTGVPTPGVGNCLPGTGSANGQFSEAETRWKCRVQRGRASQVSLHQALQLVASRGGWERLRGMLESCCDVRFSMANTLQDPKNDSGNADVLWHWGARLWPRMAVPSICWSVGRCAARSAFAWVSLLIDFLMTQMRYHRQHCPVQDLEMCW